MDEPRLIVPLEDEPLDAYLVRRERELTQQVAALLGALVPKQSELEAVRKMMDARGLPHGSKYTDSLAPFLETIGASQEPHVLHTPPAFGSAAMGMTIKQMILAALRDHFHDGATPAELRDYMRSAYGREIDRTSISPQLSRLRDQGAVVSPLAGNREKWVLTSAGRRYGHPSSFPED